VSWFLEHSRVGLPSFRISPTMSDTQSLNTSFREVMISPKNEGVFIRDLSDFTLQMISILGGLQWMLTRSGLLPVVLTTVPGYPAAVRVWNRTGWSSHGCDTDNSGTHRVRGQVRTRLRLHFTVPTTLAPIKYLSSDRIMKWSVRKLCSISRSFTSRIQICDSTDIRWVAVK
jgi:hypothetical protein